MELRAIGQPFDSRGACNIGGKGRQDAIARGNKDEYKWHEKQMEDEEK
jgi:hypothetical protein